MSKRSIRDEMEILQAHEQNAQSLLRLWQDGRIDLDSSEDATGYAIESALKEVCHTLYQAIISRDQQLRVDTDPRMERYPYEH